MGLQQLTAHYGEVSNRMNTWWLHKIVCALNYFFQRNSFFYVIYSLAFTVNYYYA